MTNIAIQLNPHLLENPDMDIRYLLPDILVEQSGGVIVDNGYDYVGSEPKLVIFLKTTDLHSALPCIIKVIETVPICENQLQASAVIAAERENGWSVVYPTGINDMIDLS